MLCSLSLLYCVVMCSCHVVSDLECTGPQTVKSFEALNWEVAVCQELLRNSKL